MRVLLLLCIVSLSGCQAGYYWHLVSGHSSLMGAREPVADLLADPATDPALQAQLQLSREALAFAEDALALSADGSYRDYVSLPKNWVVWNLFAAPEFSLQAHQWCYPVAGCASYRGFFDRQRADRAAARLRKDGLDVYGAGAIAYSTLGWFNDPLTTPMLQRAEGDLVELLFHELVHQRFYLKGDTRFNESLATAVARHGRRAWFQAHGLAEPVSDGDAAWQTVRDILDDTRAALETLYASALADTQKRQRKQAIQARARTRFRQALETRPALARWQSFFDGPLNNAQLNTVADYHQWVPAFSALIEQCQAQWPCFWDAVDTLAGLDQAARSEALMQLQAGRQNDD